MSRLISLECDHREVRLAVGTVGLTGISVERVLAVPIQVVDSETPITSEAFEAALRDVVSRSGLKSGNAVVCVGRGDVELRSITLPKVDANELPEMVRFSAPRYFANFGDNWPIDFIPLPSTQEGSVECFAGSINPAVLHRIEQIVTSAGLSLSNVVLRPMAATIPAIVKHPEWNTESVMFVDLLGDEADVAIVHEGNFVFMRTFRWDGDDVESHSVPLLTSEIKRSLLSANSQRPNLSVNRVIVWGSGTHDQLIEDLSKSLGLVVQSLDPFSLVDRSKANVDASIGAVGRFAPVLGALFAQQQSNRLIDFVNPRKRIEKKKPILQYSIAAAATVLLVGGGIAWYYSSIAALDAEIVSLNKAIADDQDLLKVADKNLSDWKKVEAFLKGDYHWLDELESLSVRAKSSDEIIFGGSSFVLDPRSNIGTISTTIYSKKQETLPLVHAAFRDKTHIVKSTRITDSPNKEYPHAGDLKIVLAERKPIKPTDASNSPSKEESKESPSSKEAAESRKTDLEPTNKEQEGSNAEPNSTEPSKDSEPLKPADPTPPSNEEPKEVPAPEISPAPASKKEQPDSAPDVPSSTKGGAE